jgi:hypothetical protein
MSRPLTFLCIAFYFKGSEFLRACKEAGNTVYLLTKKKLENRPWPWEAIDEVFYMESDENTPENFSNMAKGFAFLLRSRPVDRVVALDDFDVEKGAFLREEFRIPGMGQTTARYFRDKLAMRVRAQETGLLIPSFSALFHDADINHYLEYAQGPWLIKPRGEASATGIRKVHNAREAWQVFHELGENRFHFLIEQFRPGDVYHVDALSFERQLVFCRSSRYLNTPFEVMHGGGIFRSATIPFDSDEDAELRQLTQQVMEAFGMRHSASHTEFIRSREDGRFYFLETASRVGGAHLSDMVEHSSGLNLWAEWARLETAAARGEKYHPPLPRYDHAGIIVSLSRFERPDDAAFNDPEIVWRLRKDHHIGLIVRSPSHERVIQLLDQYAWKIGDDFHASAPAPDRPHD